jgi:hypothetical protein
MGEHMRSITWRLITIIGAVTVLIGVLGLPWVGFADPIDVDRQVADFLANVHVQDLLDRIPQLRETLGISRMATTEDVSQLFASPDLRRILSWAREKHRFTGWDLWRRVPKVNRYLRWALMLAVVLAPASAILWILSMVTTSHPVSWLGTLAYALGAFLLFLWMVWLLPAVDTFGMRSDFGVALVCLLTGSHIGIGVWVTLLGLGLIAVGGGINLVLCRQSASANGSDIPYGEE